MRYQVDLRSDTVTRPDAGMRRAMAEAEVGDDVFGDDPTVRRLEEETAEILGKEAALFLPSGTMGNQVAIAAHTRRGDEVICEATAHIFLYEAYGPAVLSAVQLHPLPGDRGLIDRAALCGAIRADDPHFPVTRLVALENTHNRAGGRVLPYEALRELTSEASAHGLATHLDGARLWNAAAASGTAERVFASLFDSVSVCYSKGLGAPVGSAVAGRAAWIAEARRHRKRFGGGMRQAGIIAAGALYALQRNRARLPEDHERARRLAHRLTGIPGFAVDPAVVETNIVVARLAAGAAEPDSWVRALADRGIGVVRFGPRALRMVTHLDVSEEGLELAVSQCRAVAAELASAGSSADQTG